MKGIGELPNDKNIPILLLVCTSGMSVLLTEGLHTVY